MKDIQKYVCQPVDLWSLTPETLNHTSLEWMQAKLQ